MYLWNQRSPSLAGLRPNQAMNRAYAGWTNARAPIGPVPPGLGDITDLSQPLSVDPKLLLLGIGALGLGLFLFGVKKGPQMRAKKVARLAAQRSRISKRIQELEA